MSSFFFTSDTHFGHDNIIRYCNRPFTSSDEMDAVMIQRWNERVRPNDVVWHMGDFGFGKKATVRYLEWVLRQLHGQIHIVWGNHDEETRKLAHMFRSCHELTEVRVRKQWIVLCHYGMRTWHRNMKGAWHLFGHTHATMPPFGKSFDVGVDTNNFYPYSFADIEARMATLPERFNESNFKCRVCLRYPCECKDVQAEPLV